MWFPCDCENVASFDETTSQVIGYIAHVQQNVADNGAFLLIAGGGFFPHSTATLHYKQLHKNDQC